MSRRTNHLHASSSRPSYHRNNRRGRGSGGGGSGGDGITPAKIFRFVGLVATMLPARVAGQSMTCQRGNDRNVQSSDATLALFNNIAQGVTFTEYVGYITSLMRIPNPFLPSFLSTHLQTSVSPTDRVHSAL